MKILAVEDDPVAQLVIEAALRSLGHEAVLAATGAEAWRKLEAEPVPIIVSDWKMPEMDGLELCRRVRRRPGDYIYFLLLTQHSAADENHQAALEAGVDDLLAKPVSVRELKMRLHVADRILNLLKVPAR